MTQSNSDEVLIAYYTLLFVDILAQKEKLDQTAHLPVTVEQRAPFIEGLKATSGQVELFRHFFDQFFSPEGTDELAAVEPKSEEERKLLEICKRTNLTKQCFSDTMIYYSCTMDRPDSFAITSIYALLSAAAAGFFLTLSLKLPCRAAIELGTAREFSAGDLYGHAVKQVYTLESQVAQFPRVVVGPNLVEFIANETKFPGESPAAKYRREFASFCLNWILGDVDGVYFLDYAGPTTKKVFPDFDDGTIHRAIDFVISEWTRFKATARTVPLHQTLATRYYLVLQYLNSRKQFWKEIDSVEQ